MKFQFFIIFFLVVMLGGCTTSSDRIIGLSCFNLSPEERMVSVDPANYQQYVSISDSFLGIENVPLTRVVNSTEKVMYVGLGIAEAGPIDSVLSLNPNLTNQREDDWGKHYLFFSSEYAVHLLLHKGEGNQPVLFFNVFNDKAAAEASFSDKDYFAQHLKCN